MIVMYEFRSRKIMRRDNDNAVHDQGPDSGGDPGPGRGERVFGKGSGVWGGVYA